MIGSLFGRVKTGLRMALASFAVLRRRKGLLVFPILYGLVWLVGLLGLVGGVVAALFGAGYGMAALEGLGGSIDATDGVLEVVLVLGGVFFMFFATTLATFFSAALVFAVGKTFEGEPTGVRGGLAGAWEAKWTILAWGVVGTTIGLIVNALENRTGQVAVVVRQLLGFAWSVMTFFIVPVIVLQGEGIRSSARQSLDIFRQNWGEAGGLTLGIGLIMFPLIAVVAGVGIGLPLLLAETPWELLQFTLVPTVLVMGVLLVVYQAANGVAKTALYQYATGGSLPPEFDGIDPEQLGKTGQGGPGSSRSTTGHKPGQI